MILLLLIFTGILLIFSSILLYKKIMNPILIILLWYIGGVIISNSEILGMYKPKAGSTEFILLNIIILCFTFFIVSKIKIRKKIATITIIPANILDKLIYYFRIGTFIIQFILAIRLLMLLITGRIDISSIRIIVYSLSYNSDAYTMIFINSLIYNIFSFFIKGFVLFDISWNLCEVLIEHKKIRYISLANLLLYCFIILSRIEILRVFIIFIITVISVKYYIRNNNEKRNNRKFYMTILIFFSIIMAITFSLRTSNGESTIINSVNELIISLTGSYVVFGNYYMSFFEGLRLINSNIIAILCGGLEPVFNLILNIFGISGYAPTSILNQYIINGVNIGASDHYNAFYTMYYNFLAAGGILGCLIASIFLGGILCITYRAFIGRPSAKTLLIYVFTLHIIILGSIRWELSTFSIWFMLILIIMVNARNDKLYIKM